MSTLTASLDLPPTATSVPAARRMIRQLLRSWGARQDVDDAALLLTELVANAVDHEGGTSCPTVEATYSEDWLRLAVADCSPDRSVMPAPDAEDRKSGVYGKSVE